MRSAFGRYAILTAIALVVGIDVTLFLGGGSIRAVEFSVVESVIDIMLIVTAFVTLTQEITERKRSQAELENANRVKTAFMNMAAHDLRNPIAVIAGYAEILADEESGNPENRELARRILRQSRDMVTLIDDILEAAVVTQTSADEPREKLVLTSLAREVLADFETRAAEKGLTLDWQCPKSVKAQVVARAVRLRQVIANLLSNAIKFSPPGSVVLVNVEEISGRVRLSVKDQGPGLSQTELTQVFEPFSKVKKKATAGETSTGLGLSITKTLVEQQGGKIWAESLGPGKGAIFVVDLPLHASRQTP